jgi:hypothetical protein
MNAETIGLVCIGSVLHAVTFTVGVLIGVSLRKDSRHDDSNEGTKEAGWWHQPASTGTQGGARSRGTSGAEPVSTSHLPERAPIGRGAFWE